MLILFILFPTLALIEILARVIPNKNSKKLSEYLRKKLYWNSSIRLFRESYAIALMCALINMKAFTLDTSGEVFSVILAVLIIFLAIAVPIVLTVKIHTNFNQLTHKRILGIFGASYDHMKLKECNDSETISDK